MQISILLLFFLTISTQSLSQSSDLNEKQINQKINVINKKIAEVKKKLNQAYGHEKHLLDQLESHDQKINRIINETQKSQIEINQTQQNIDDLTAQIETQNNSIKTQRDEIVELIKLQIYINHDKTLKMFMLYQQSQPSDLLKHQLKYLQHKLYKLIKSTAIEIESLKKLVRNQDELKNLEQIKQTELLKQQELLLAERKLRTDTLRSLQKEIAQQEKTNENLNQDQQRLKSLLSEIINLLGDLPTDLGNNLSFAKLKGKLIQPIPGKTFKSFKSQRSENTKWNGIVIRAQFGQEVKSVAYGRVAFAEWLRGFGMLVILDHHDGYMTLYGFNQSIHVEMGDWVEKDQVLATVGNTGSLNYPSLYFEIRKNATPINPKSWLRR